MVYIELNFGFTQFCNCYFCHCKGYGYYIVNPWRPRQDEVVRRMLEAGLIPKWMERTWYRMKEEYREELKRTGDEGIKFEFKPLISAITLDDFQVRLEGLYNPYTLNDILYTKGS